MPSSKNRQSINLSLCPKKLDQHSSRYAAANAGLLYTAKGTAALLVPLTSVLAARGGWGAVFITASVLNLVAAFLALVVLKPMRRRMQVS